MRQKKWGFFNTKYLIRANPNKCKKWSTIRSLNHFWSTISPILFRLSTKSLYVKITSILWIRTTKTQNNQQFIMSTQVRESRFFEKKKFFFREIEISLFHIDPEQNQDPDDDDTNTNDEFNTSDSNNSNHIYFDTTSKEDNDDSDIPEDEEILDISTRDLEQPIELTGIEDLPIQRTKFYLPPLISEDSDSVELYQRPDDAIDYGTMNNE